MQLGDDLQDVRQDLKENSATVFMRAARAGIPLDALVRQLLSFSTQVADQLDALPHGDLALKRLLRMSWRSLIVMAVARSHQLFTPAFLAEIEPESPFRFEFLRKRHKRLSGRSGLYRVLFDSFLESSEVDLGRLPQPENWIAQSLAREEDSAIAFAFAR